MKTKLLALLLLAGSSVIAAPRVFVGIGVGVGGYGYVAPPPPAPVVAYAAPAPGPGYSWVAGYWYPVGPRWACALDIGLRGRMPGLIGLHHDITGVDITRAIGGGNAL